MKDINRTVRYNLVYRLRKKGYTVITAEKTIVSNNRIDPMQIRQIRRLTKEFHYRIQLSFI
ncbi:MAG: hypothetical protein LBR08_10430 [Bacteroidales bacterium]|jgi:hypothetical protein|nr:hypothetical protein [Bacteroidales bacterium]